MRILGDYSAHKEGNSFYFNIHYIIALIVYIYICIYDLCIIMYYVYILHSVYNVYIEHSVYWL